MQRLSYGFEPTVTICADTPDGIARATADVASVGARVVATLSIDRAADALAEGGPVDAVLVEASHDAGPAFDRLLDRLNLDAAAGRTGSVVIVPPNLIDAASARIAEAGVTLLCVPDAVERLGALGMTLASRPALVMEERSDDSPVQLRRLSEEVGRIARQLAAMSAPVSRADPAGQPAFEAEGARELPAAAPIRALIRRRRLRDRFFSAELFADPAWDMLLDLMLARVEGRSVAVSSLCIAAAVPPTTALRWIKRLTDEGLFVRTADPRDGRRVFIDLSDATAGEMSAYLHAIWRSGTPAV